MFLLVGVIQILSNFTNCLSLRKGCLFPYYRNFVISEVSEMVGMLDFFERSSVFRNTVQLVADMVLVTSGPKPMLDTRFIELLKEPDWTSMHRSMHMTSPWIEIHAVLIKTFLMPLACFGNTPIAKEGVFVFRVPLFIERSLCFQALFHVAKPHAAGFVLKR